MGGTLEDRLPDDVEELKALVVALRDESAGLREEAAVSQTKAAALREESRRKDKRITLLEQRIADLWLMIKGPRSEKARYFDPEQECLLPFPEFEELRRRASEIEAEAETAEIQGHRRGRTGRRTEFPPHLPRLVLRHELDEKARTCPCGTRMQEDGAVRSETLERIEVCYVHVDELCRYRCPACRKAATADLPDRLIDGGILGPSAIAQVIYDRFAAHMPYARIETKWKHEGVDVDRSVLCTTVGRVAELLEPVHREMARDILEGPVVQSDSTTAVQRRGPLPGRDVVHVFCWRTHDRGTFYTIFDSLSRDGPRSVLAGHELVLQTDGHDCFTKIEGVSSHPGCWAHLRRYFKKARDRGDPLAKPAMDLLDPIFNKEDELEGLRDSPEALHEARQREVRPLVDDFYTWVAAKLLELDAGTLDSLPRGNFAKGLVYARNQEESLRCFLEDGRIRDITNNASERALRSVVLGRKNWLFFGSEEGARRGSILMGLVQTCRDLGVNPLEYLRDVMQQIQVLPAAEIHRLIPRVWKDDPEAQDRVLREQRWIVELLGRLEPAS